MDDEIASTDRAALYSCLSQSAKDAIVLDSDTRRISIARTYRPGQILRISEVHTFQAQAGCSCPVSWLPAPKEHYHPAFSSRKERQQKPFSVETSDKPIDQSRLGLPIRLIISQACLDIAIRSHREVPSDSIGVILKARTEPPFRN